MKRHQRHFERQSAKHQSHADVDQQVGAVRVLPDQFADQPDFSRPGSRVDQRHSINQNGGRESSDQQILDSGFLGRLAFPTELHFVRRTFPSGPVFGGKPAQNIKCDGKNFESDEGGDQVSGFCQKHHPHGREKYQCKVLGLVFVIRLRVAHRAKNGEQGHDEKNNIEALGKLVVEQGVAEHCRVLPTGGGRRHAPK